MKICDTCNENLSHQKIMFYDIVKINEKYYTDDCLIPWDIDANAPEDEEYIMDVSFFYDYVAEKYGCDVEDVRSMFMDGLDIPREVFLTLPYGEEWIGGHCPVCNGIL